MSPARTGITAWPRMGPEFEISPDHVNCGPVNRHARGQRARVGVEPWEQWQDRRVNVEQLIRPARNETCRQHPHETRKADDLRTGGVQGRVERRLEARPIGMSAVIDADRLRAERPGTLQSSRIGPVGQNEARRCRMAWSGHVANERLHVGASAGYEDCDAPSAHNSPW